MLASTGGSEENRLSDKLTDIINNKERMRDMISKNLVTGSGEEEDL